MDFILKKKSACTNEQFIHVWNNIERYVSYDEAKRLVDVAVLDIIQKTKGKRVGYAWSGGKDSLALQYVCELAGIHQGVIGLSTPIEYPDFLHWLDRHCPEGVVRWDAKIGIDWLVAHPDMLFPCNSTIASRWFPIIQHRAQAWFFKRYGLEVICLGRRTQDGNYVGKNGENIYTDGKGVVRFSPISHWKHEEVLAVIHYFMNRNLPPTYDYPNGWIEGTGVWPSKQTTASIESLWQELYTVDKSILEYAATKINSANEFLKLKNQNND